MQDVNSTNVKAVLESRCVYYEEQAERLRTLLEEDGVTIESYGRQRQSLLQGLAVDVGRDLSIVARVKLQCVGSPYFSNMLSDFSFYLKDYLGSLRLFAGSEKGAFVG